MQKAIDKRVDSLLSQSPKALAAMAAQLLWDMEEGKVTLEAGGDAVDVFVNKFVTPMDAKTRSDYRMEFTELREHKLMYEWFKTAMRLTEARRDHLTMFKIALTCLKAYDDVRAYAGLPVSEIDIKLDVDAGIEQLTGAIEEAETTLKEWNEPDIWRGLGYEPPDA